jgi:hypothetical protein
MGYKVTVMANWLAVLGLVWSVPIGQAPAPKTIFEDGFAEPELDSAKWVHTVLNDFETETVDIRDGRLRMAAASIGTNDQTVKFHGVRTKDPVVDLSSAVQVAFELDWNDQANGCYMTAGAYICPTIAENPRDQPAWLQFTYIGVPPGQNARCWISVQAADHERVLLNEKWPEERMGRTIGLQKVEMALDRDALIVAENGTTILESHDLRLGFDKAYLYLQHSTHSNYRLREAFFDNVAIRR